MFDGSGYVADCCADCCSDCEGALMRAPLVIRNRRLSGLLAAGKGTAVRWGGKPVVVHHTAGRVPHGRGRRALIRDEKRVVRETQDQHLAQGWSDIGYHLLIMPSGRVYRGRAPRTMGAHAGDNFGNSCPGVVIVGNYDLAAPTVASLDAFRHLHKMLRRKYNVSRVVHPHSRYFATACPGKYLKRALGL